MTTPGREDIRVIRLDSRDPQANLAYEKQLFDELRGGPVAACLFYTNDPCIIAGQNNRLEQWVDLAAVERDGIPVIRRISGGGAVYQDHWTLNYSFIVPKKTLEGPGRRDSATARPLKYIDFFRAIVIRALSRGGGGYSATRISDISLQGRKISGNAQRIAGNLVLHHGTLLMKCPLEAIQRYLPNPPDRPDINHEDFVTGLHEEGRRHSAEELRMWIAAEFRQSVGS